MQVPGNVNLTLNAVQSSVCYALKALLDPELPNNQAAIDAVEIVAPVGSVANCVAPAAVALRANTCQRVIDVVIGALADVLPEQAIGAANGANTSIVFAGIDPRSGAPYVYLETLGGGMGGATTATARTACRCISPTPRICPWRPSRWSTRCVSRNTRWWPI